MNKSYSFTLDTEPSEEQLNGLMLAVLEDVKIRASRAEEKFKNLQLQSLKQSLEIWEQKQSK
jgi:hypothetical protein